MKSLQVKRRHRGGPQARAAPDRACAHLPTAAPPVPRRPPGTSDRPSWLDDSSHHGQAQELV